MVLVLSGEGLRDRGRFVLERVPAEDAIELRYEESEQVLRFERRKGMRPPRPSAPK